MQKKKVRVEDVFHWKAEQLTLLEAFLFCFGFSLIGLGLGTITGSMTGQVETFYVWIGWGITIIPFALILLRLGVFKQRK